VSRPARTLREESGGSVPNFTNLKGGFSSITSTRNSSQNNGARTLQFALKLFY